MSLVNSHFLKINLNTASVRQFIPFSGFCPVLAKIIVKNAPYRNVQDEFNLPGLTESQKTAPRDSIQNFRVDKRSDNVEDLLAGR